MFSKDLEISIASLFDKAQDTNIQYITVEHLFLMILSDGEVASCLESHNIKIDQLKDAINNHLKSSPAPRGRQRDELAHLHGVDFLVRGPRAHVHRQVASSAGFY